MAETTFKAILKRSDKAITNDRAERVSKGANREYKRLIDCKEEEMDLIDEQIDRMLDMSASNSTQVDNKVRDFDSVTWVNTMADLELKKEMLRLEITVIKEKVGKYFGGV